MNKPQLMRTEGFLLTLLIVSQIIYIIIWRFGQSKSSAYGKGGRAIIIETVHNYTFAHKIIDLRLEAAKLKEVYPHSFRA
jgi:hypothetical protein